MQSYIHTNSTYTYEIALDEFTEMNQLNEDKNIFGELFDKIDPDDNGDVDEKEWISGLRRLAVEIPTTDMSKVFKLMNGDKSGYIDRQDWITFCMTTYQSNELQRIQDSVLTRLKGHSRQPSNMFNPNDASEWNSHSMRNMQQDMQNAAMHMGAHLQAQVEAEQVFYEDIENAQSKDPDFGKIVCFAFDCFSIGNVCIFTGKSSRLDTTGGSMVVGLH